MRTLLFFSLASLIIAGCSSMPKITRDYRSLITHAPAWEENFIPFDSGSGIVFQIRKIADDSHQIHADFNLWSYPLDTVTFARKVIEPIGQPAVWGDFYDATYLYYKIRNDTISISTEVDSTNQFAKKLPPGTYFFSARSDWFSPRSMRNIIVRKGYWSIVKLYWSWPYEIVY